MDRSLVCVSPSAHIYIDNDIIYMVYKNTRVIYDINKDDAYVVEKHDDAVTIRHVDDDLRKTLLIASIKTKLDVIDFTCVETERIMVSLYRTIEEITKAIKEIELLSDLGI